MLCQDSGCQGSPCVRPTLCVMDGHLGNHIFAGGEGRGQRAVPAIRQEPCSTGYPLRVLCKGIGPCLW